MSEPSCRSSMRWGVRSNAPRFSTMQACGTCCSLRSTEDIRGWRGAATGGGHPVSTSRVVVVFRTRYYVLSEYNNQEGSPRRSFSCARCRAELEAPLGARSCPAHGASWSPELPLDWSLEGSNVPSPRAEDPGQAGGRCEVAELLLRPGA